MEARTVNNLPSAGTYDDAICCVLAIELSKKSWIVAVNTPLSDKISRHTLKPGDGKELLDLCERIRTRVARETKKRVEMASCYEAGYDGFWLHRLAEKADQRVAVTAIETATGLRLASVKEACRYGKFSTTKCYELINAGRIKAKKFDTRTLVDLDSIDAMYAALPNLVPNPGAKS